MQGSVGFTKESSSEKNYKSVDIWQNYGYESVARFLAHPVDTLLANQTARKAMTPTTDKSRSRKMADCPSYC